MLRVGRPSSFSPDILSRRARSLCRSLPGSPFRPLRRSLRQSLRPAILAVFTSLLMSAASFAGTVSGTVTNGTTGKVAAGADVILIALQGGMQTVASTRTDAQGKYHFDNPQLGVSPMLIRVVYKGVNYHQPAPPGQSDVPVEVYEPTTDPAAFSVDSRFLVFEPRDTSLVVGEEYDVENRTQPPKTFSAKPGSFSFYLPPSAQLQQVSALGPGGMPVQQGTIDRGDNLQSIDFPFRPGQNNVRVSYTLPYPNNQATVHTVSPYAARRVLVVVPPTMQVLSPGFAPAGTEQGFNVYSRDSVAANSPLDISISGTAPPPQASSSSSSGQGGAGVDDSGASDSNGPTATGEIVPARLDNIKWLILACFSGLFGLGAVFLLLRPRYAAGSGAGNPASPPAPISPPSVAASNPIAPEESASFRHAERAVQGSLDEIRDRLFKLELRHQAGTLSDADYARQRAEAENLLRGLLRD